MKKKNSVQNTSSTPETNYKKLSDALRDDMRSAAELLLKLRTYQTENAKIEEFESVMFAHRRLVDDALAALDCIDHIPEMLDSEDLEEFVDSEIAAGNLNWGIIGNSLEALEYEKERLAQARKDSKTYLEYIELTTQFSDLSHEIGRRKEAEIDDAIEAGTDAVFLRGIIKGFRKITTHKGQQMAIMTLDTGVDIVVFPRTLQKFRDDIENISYAKVEATFDCQDSDDDRDEYFLNSIVGFNRIENTVDDLNDELIRINEDLNEAETYELSDELAIQYNDLEDEIDRREEAEQDVTRTYSAMPEYDHTDYQFCDDCGRTNCICWECD